MSAPIGEQQIAQRQVQLIRLALIYVFANYDDLHECFAMENDDTKWHLAGGDIDPAPTQREFEELTTEVSKWLKPSCP